jgi:hypothetical protein
MVGLRGVRGTGWRREGNDTDNGRGEYAFGLSTESGNRACKIVENQAGGLKMTKIDFVSQNLTRTCFMCTYNTLLSDKMIISQLVSVNDTFDST